MQGELPVHQASANMLCSSHQELGFPPAPQQAPAQPPSEWGEREGGLNVESAGPGWCSLATE